MSLNDMMLFRLAYLKAIALSWREPASLKRMIEVDDGWAFFREKKLEPLPAWDIDLRFRPDQLPGAGFRPAQTGGWVGPNFLLELRLPKAPNPSDQPLALAQYYAALPTPFGVKGKEEPKKCECPCHEDEAEKGRGRVHNYSSAGAGGAGMGHWSDAVVLGGVILRALALSWSDDDFRWQLGENPLQALQNWLGYNCPWNVTLRVEYTDLTWDAHSRAWSEKPRNRLTLYLPSKPDVTVNGEPISLAVALAAYNQTGDAYPLTCP